MLKPKTTSVCFVLCCILFTLQYQFTHAQTHEFANVISSQQNVDVPTNAVDGNLLTAAGIRANSGLILGAGAYSGHLELEFPTLLSPNTTSYVRLETEDDLLPSLLGGSLGGLLSNIAGTLLIGNQEFTTTVKNGNTTVLEELSNGTNPFSSNNLRVVTDVNNDYYLAVSPNTQYNRIRLTNRLGSLIGLNNTKTIDVYGAYHSLGVLDCGAPSFTSFNGNGITLDLLNLGGAGVTDPHLVLDGNPNTYSEVSLGILGIAAIMEQTVYFDTPSAPGDNFYMTIALDPSLLELGIANNIQLITQNESEAPISTITLSSLLDLDLLGLLQNGETATLAIPTGGSATRITVRISSLLNVNLAQLLRIYDVFRAPALPQLLADSQDVHICSGTSVGLTANTTGTNEIRWYDAETGGTLLATLSSGEAFTTPVLTADTTYYVASANPSCPEESPRVAVEVNVVPIPTAVDIDITGNESAICSSNDVILVPSSSIDGTFSWYFDANATLEITDGMTVGSVTYSISNNGVLSISGLDEANGPYTFYTRLTESLAGCENVAGDLRSVVVNVVDSNSSAVITLDTSLTLDSVISILGGTPALVLNGTVSGDVNIGDTITLSINGNLYTGVLDNSLAFNISVDGTDLIFDANSIVEVFVEGTLCTLTEEILIDLPILEIDNLLQIFCASDLPTIADLELNGLNIVIFDSLTGSAQLSLDTPLVDGGLYFAGILNLPISILSRVQINVEVIELPIPTTVSVTQTLCLNANATIADILVNETNVVAYASLTGGTILNADTPLIDGNTYFLASIEGVCESLLRLAITIQLEEDEPITLDGVFEDACLGQTYTYITESDKQNYIWTISGGTIISGGTTIDDFATVSWSNLTDTSINVAYTDTLSCVNSKDFSLDVSVIECGEIMGEQFCLFVFNEFTPNNDGFNDFFEVRCIEDYSSSIEVYNRNGNKVFQTIDYQNDWNGIANVSGILNSGDHLPSGTYYYVINIPELNRELVGWLQLARE